MAGGKVAVLTTEKNELLPQTELPTEQSLQTSSVPQANQAHLQRYRIEVKSQGCMVAEYEIEAADALQAINMVESYFGDPVKIEQSTVETEDGRKRHLLIVENWHGYTFDARAIEP